MNVKEMVFEHVFFWPSGLTIYQKWIIIWTSAVESSNQRRSNAFDTIGLNNLRLLEEGEHGMAEWFKSLFGVAKPVIAMVHFPALPGTPRYDPRLA